MADENDPNTPDEPSAPPEQGQPPRADSAPEAPASDTPAQETPDQALFESEPDEVSADAIAVAPDVEPEIEAISAPDEDSDVPDEDVAPPEEEAPAAEAPVEETPVNTPIAAQDEAPAQPSDLPHQYFRAAGDPDEGEAEAPPSQWGRFSARVEQTARDAWAVIEPKWVAFWGATRTTAGALWDRIRGVRRPKTLREAAVWTGWLAAGGVAFVIGFFFFVTWGMPSTDDLWEARQGQSITFLDRNGNVILREGAQNAPPVELDTLPPYVAQAFLAIEDRRFYDHFGIDFGGLMRAGAENLRAGRVVQGGSTITQQLAKNLFLTNDRTWRRKAQEVMLALWLESRFSKDEILALYLSRVYFGAGAYGIEAASERYFDRPARELTLLQAAMLAGLVKAPSRLNPARQDIDAARDRASVVLNEMVAIGYISATERDAALQEELVISRRNPAGVLSYYRDWIDPLLNEVIGQQRDDFIVETTIDIAAQRAAVESVEAILAEQGEERRVSQAAALFMDDQGGVRVMVGGRDYDQSQFNRATQARRQPGSSFKYFIYLAAMENGLTPWSVREDAPITIYIDGQPPWTPGNYT
ncbi:MAG: transglycosylase domain-containing protein, partial [Hyphomonadaceae bacterium]|nr:transglycosylase domain-containing protein [Hyphomonadaceae bacterium]